jgi:hypothetical protein
MIVVTAELPNGRVEFSLGPTYTIGTRSTIEFAVVVTSGSVRGPLDARVMASGMGEGGAPAEVLVRRLTVSPATVTAGQRENAMVTWDGIDEKGARVPSDAYVLVLEFDAIDGGTTRRVNAAATLQMND